MAKKVSRGCSVFAAALVLFFLIAGADHALRSASAPGYCPEDADWTAFAEDLPCIWESAEQSSAAKILSEELPFYMHQVELALRNATGIRPEPFRWRVWMGSEVLVSGKSGQWGFCVCPGVLLRVAHAVNRMFHPAENGLYQYGDFYYAWRDRFFIVSPWPEYVRASLAATSMAVPPTNLARDSIHLAWKIPVKGEMRLRIEAPHVEGQIDLAMPAAPNGLQLPDAWPEPPMISLTVSSLDAPFAILYPMIRNTAAFQFFQPGAQFFWSRWNLPPLPDTWNQNVLEYAWVLHSVDTSSTLPIPQMALALRTTPSPENNHPLLSLIANEPPVPSFWNEHPGWIMPWLGEKLSLCLVQTGTCALATSQEPLMARLAGRMNLYSINANALALRADWAKIGDSLSALLRQAAPLELIPEKDSRDVEQDVIPIARALSRLGKLRIDASSDGNKLFFSGTLFSEEGTSP
ncbi:MAG TPA: hypothetical protein PLI09_11705 [Candidatus Hydrogenedentes bacterium]|nr:hypothetical protein [Candidatus Hydrogenedentota bacterium]